MAKKRSRGKPVLSMACYIVQIADWDWSYSFGLNSTSYDDRRYSDYRHLLLRGTVVLPSKLKLKIASAELTILPDIRETD